MIGQNNMLTAKIDIPGQNSMSCENAEALLIQFWWWCEGSHGVNINTLSKLLRHWKTPPENPMNNYAASEYKKEKRQ